MALVMNDQLISGIELALLANSIQYIDYIFYSGIKIDEITSKTNIVKMVFIHGYPELIKTLFKNGLSINYVIESNILHYIIVNDNKELLELLFEYGLKIEHLQEKYLKLIERSITYRIPDFLLEKGLKLELISRRKN